MSKEEAILRYKSAMYVFKNWWESGVIIREELAIIDTKTAEKYGLSSCSIYRENGLLYRGSRANIG